MSTTRHYAVVMRGGRERILSINAHEDVDIAVSEQFTAEDPEAVEFYVELQPDDPEHPDNARNPASRR